jgi:hypothetical protein
MRTAAVLTADCTVSAKCNLLAQLINQLKLVFLLLAGQPLLALWRAAG